MAPIKVLLWLLPQVVLPRPQDLRAAQNDEVELERLGCRLGPQRLLRIAAQGAQAGERVAALRALGLCGGGDRVVAAQALRPLAELLARLLPAEAPLLERGVHAAVRLGRCLGRGLLDGSEGPREDLTQAAAQLLQRAADDALPAELRVQLVEAATALPRPLWPPSSTTLTPLARAGERLVQQAALQALGRLAAPGQESPLAELSAEGDPAVAVPAAAVLCEAQAVPDEALAVRVRQLAAPDGGASPELRGRLAACLRRLGTAADRALLQSIPRGRRQR